MIRHSSKRISIPLLRGVVNRKLQQHGTLCSSWQHYAINKQHVESSIITGIRPIHSLSSTICNNSLSWRRAFATEQGESLPPPPMPSPRLPTTEESSSLEATKATNSEDIAPVVSSATKKAPNKKQASTTQIQLLQLQGLHSSEEIRDHFLPIIKKSDTTRLKWITTVKNQLMNKPKQKKSKGKNSTVTTTSYMSHTQHYLQKLPKEMRAAFWDLVLVETADSKKKKKKKAGTWTPPRKHVELLQKVRETAVEFPLMWSQNRKRTTNKQNQLLLEGKAHPWKQYLATRSETLAIIHNAKSEEDLVEEAKRLLETMYSSLPSRNYEKIIATFQNHVQACRQDRKLANGGPIISGKKRKRRIQILYSNIRSPTHSNIHLVAPDLADFLYVTVEDDGTTNSRNDVVSDPRIAESQKSFDSMLEKFLDSFETVHGILWKEFQHKKHEQQEIAKRREDNADIVDDGSVEAVMESFYDAVSDTKIRSKTKKDAMNPKPRSYVHFEAIALDEIPKDAVERSTILPSTAQGLQNFPSQSPDDRLIIVDNLPIDINEQVLMDAYSRCGSIESLCVFNQRPHLDPGRRSADSRKKIRNPSSFRQQWQRPRTPLYAMILFDDAQSAAKASSDPLRIFGMVLDRHLIRSYPSRDMTKLYLEDISGKYDTTSIEYQLSQILHPQLYVCLDIDGEQRPLSRRGRQQDAATSSCVVKFSDFEAAYWSYLKLSTDLELIQEGDCALQWMETPKDAMMYWTRKLNF